MDSKRISFFYDNSLNSLNTFDKCHFFTRKQFFQDRNIIFSCLFIQQVGRSQMRLSPL